MSREGLEYIKNECSVPFVGYGWSSWGFTLFAALYQLFSAQKPQTNQQDSATDGQSQLIADERLAAEEPLDMLESNTEPKKTEYLIRNLLIAPSLE